MMVQLGRYLEMTRAVVVPHDVYQGIDVELAGRIGQVLVVAEIVQHFVHVLQRTSYRIAVSVEVAGVAAAVPGLVLLAVVVEP